MKKYLAMILAVLMMLSCMPAFAEEAEDRYGRYDEPIHVTILSTDFKTGTTAYDSTDPTRRSATENAWIQAYSDYLNIEVERIIAEDATALNALITTGMASGDLPDAVLVDKNTFYNMVENEVCADLLDAYNNYEQKHFLSQAADEMLFTGMVDGKLLGFPIVGNSYNSTQLLWVRQDWLDKVGKQVPTTIDELIDVAKAFMDAKLGGEDTIGLGMDMGGYSGPDFIAASYGSVWRVWNEQEDGSYVWGKCMVEENKQALLKMQEIYQSGIIRPDFASNGTLSADIANGVCGMYFATAWHSVTDIKTNLVNDPEADWVCAFIPTLDGERVPQYTNGSVGSFLVVNPECEHPEAFFKMMELELKVFIEPSAEELPKLYAGTDDFLYWDLRIFRNLNLANFDLYRSDLVNEHLALGTAVEDVPACITDYYGQVTRALAGERALWGRYLCQKYGFQMDKQLLEGGYTRLGYNGPITETMLTYQDTLNEELDNAIVKVIMGEDVSVYEDAVAYWYANGGETITQEVTDYQNSLK